MGGAPFGEVPVYAAGFRQCLKPVFDPVVKLAGSDGGKCWLVLAVELFAVAPESLKRRDSNTLSGRGNTENRAKRTASSNRGAGKQPKQPRTENKTAVAAFRSPLGATNVARTKLQ